MILYKDVEVWMIMVVCYPSLLKLDSNFDLASQEIKSTWQLRVSIHFFFIYITKYQKTKKNIIQKNSLKETFWGYKLDLETLDDDYDTV